MYTNKLLRILVTLMLIILGVIADPGPDELVSNVPNYPTTFMQRVFAGYLQTQSSLRKLHYVFMESTNISSPVTLWMNGGPGCSSKLGFLQEIPPYYLDLNTPYSTDMNFTGNPYTWLAFSHLLFIDSPAGVGFSINKDKSFVYNDANTARDNLFALQDFFTSKFPQYSANDFYITGQSYAGKYIPDLALRIFESNRLFPNNTIKLKGLLIGNGVLNFLDLYENQIEYILSHDFVDPKLFPYYQRSCRIDSESAGCQYFMERYNDLTNLIDPYNVYGPCYTPDTKSQRNFVAAMAKKNSKLFKGQPKPPLKLQQCGSDAGIQSYFNINKDSFHVLPDAPIFSVCNYTIFDNYQMTPSGSMNEMARLLSRGDVKIYLFNGDWDSVVPFGDTVKNLMRLGVRQQIPTAPWSSGDQHAGFNKTYDYGLSFYTVKGAGHQVPQYQRERASTLFQHFLKPY